MKTKLHATIPVVQYGNIRPVFEAEDGQSYEEFYSEAKDHLVEIWRQFGESPLPGGEMKIIDTFTQEKIKYDPVAHIYTDLEGNRLESASQYADRVSPKFDMDNILPKTAKAWGVKEDELREIWETNGRMSNEYGSAVHTALENWHKYKLVGKRIQDTKDMEENYLLPKNPHLKKIVESFDEKFGAQALVEVMVSDVENGRAGQIDRLETTGERNCRIGDFKTNFDMSDKKMKKYQHQLSFYAHILQNKGWTVDGLDIYHLDPDTYEWNHTELDILKLS